jgi:hypothetical protein
MKRTLFGIAVLLAIVVMSCDQSQAPSGPSSGPANKASIVRDVPVWTEVLNTCCWEEEYILLNGTAKITFNDNGLHVVVKDMTGTCIWGGHSYTVRGTAVSNQKYGDNGWHVVFSMNLVNEDGCSVLVKIHYKFVWNEETGTYDELFDHSELICDPQTEIE